MASQAVMPTGATTTAPLTPSISSTPPPPITSHSASRRSSKTGAIVGGVVGGLAFIILAGLLLLFRKRLMRRIRRLRSARVAPSSEFLDPSSRFYRDKSPNHFLAHRHGPPMSALSETSHQSVVTPVDNDLPPPFTPGAFRDPIIEKINTAAAQRDSYVRSLGSPDETRSHSSHSGRGHPSSPFHDNSRVNQSPSVEEKQPLFDPSTAPVASPIPHNEGASDRDLLEPRGKLGRLSGISDREIGWAR